MKWLVSIAAAGAVAVLLFWPSAVAQTTGPAGSGYDRVQDEGSNLTRRRRLNFTGAGVACVDNSGQARTDCTVAGTAPGGSDTQLQRNSAGAFGGLSRVTSDGSDLIIGDAAGRPAAPSAGTKSFARSVAGLVLPYFVPAGDAAWTQSPATASDWAVGCVGGVALATDAGLNLWGMFNVAATTGTATAKTLDSTTAIGSLRAVDIVSASTAGSSSKITTNGNMVVRSATAGLGGFLYFARVATTTAVAQQRALFGLAPAAGIGNSSPSAIFSTVYVGYESAETTLSACGNDASGSATCTSLGSNFPVNSIAVYDIWIYAPPAASSVSWFVERLDSSFTASGTISASGDLPASTQGLAPYVYANNGTTASAVKLRLSKMCLAARY